MLALWLAGCATDPLSRLETTTPTLTPAQVATLQKRAKSPESLGIEVELSERAAGFGGINQIVADGTTTVPLVQLPAAGEGMAPSPYRLPVIQATVNGHDSVLVLLDSGSNRNLFGYTLANSLELPLVAGIRPMPGFGIGGATESYVGIVPAMQIGTLRVNKVITMIGADANALSFTRSFWGDRQVMILSVGMLKDLSYISINYLAGTVTLSARESYLPHESSKFVSAIPIQWLGALAFVDASIDGKPNRPCLVDTGGDYGFLLPRSFARELGYWKPGKERLNTSGGVGGASLGTSYIVNQAKVGGATLDHVLSRTDLVGPEPAGGNLLLGNIVLRRYCVTFDFKHSVLWLER